MRLHEIFINKQSRQRVEIIWFNQTIVLFVSKQPGSLPVTLPMGSFIESYEKGEL